ncbi:hypothetical protein [Roseisalinus antarcticus]|uniref:Uncharacterized protein n=1 Tax=Roseisalinus antarcticus TaxID=254357 RepID=A0A1Y5SGF6_9RHOB|nr:hypothetical protein [Roseisalinus antarcticus]SLN40292.1 hypothetical protein ROA7023_01566 [Roseisalinus antarcticus]
MSAPETNLEKQEKNHRPALRGIIVSVGFAAVLLVALLVWLFATGNEPDTPETRIDGRTGGEIGADG